MPAIGTMWGRSVLALLPRWRTSRWQKFALQSAVVAAGVLIMTYAAPDLA
ncbi:hypothetical protein [Streptomyces sporangiiformans]|nr:hypothetical protein [Streptomyces sporangiiformans]